MKKRYNSVNQFLKEKFGERVYKVSLDGGFGCPNRDAEMGLEGCIFCNFASYFPATTPDRAPAGVPIREQLEDGIRYIRKRHGSALAVSYFQSGTATTLDAGKLAPMFEDAISHPSIVGLAVATRPDSLDDSHIELFREFSKRTFFWLELGLQSSHARTLKLIKRGHAPEDFLRAVSRLDSAGIRACAHVILGLPGENIEMMLETARFLNDALVWGVKLHNLHVLKGTELERMFNDGEYRPPPLETYAGWVADFLEALSPDVLIHRVSGHSPRSLTVAPLWSVNKMAVVNAVEKELERRNTFQGSNPRA